MVRLLEAFKILSKYGKNLLKPVQERPQNWRIIKYSNNVFRNKVQATMVKYVQISFKLSWAYSSLVYSVVVCGLLCVISLLVTVLMPEIF